MKKQLGILLFALMIAVGVTGAASAFNTPDKPCCKPVIVKAVKPMVLPAGHPPVDPKAVYLPAGHPALKLPAGHPAVTVKYLPAGHPKVPIVLPAGHPKIKLPPCHPKVKIITKPKCVDPKPVCKPKCDEPKPEPKSCEPVSKPPVCCKEPAPVNV